MQLSEKLNSFLKYKHFITLKINSSEDVISLHARKEFIYKNDILVPLKVKSFIGILCYKQDNILYYDRWENALTLYNENDNIDKFLQRYKLSLRGYIFNRQDMQYFFLYSSYSKSNIIKFKLSV